MARLLQNGKANGKARENEWKEVTERVGSEVQNSRDSEKEKQELSNKQRLTQ
jgi:hypothetical protein